MKEKNKNPVILKSERGQGSLEYIGILLVVVTISLSLLYQFNTAFADYAENYFGEYLACLLETGEMPNLGADNGTSCDSEFEPFDLANGRQRRMPESQTPNVQTVTESGPTAFGGGGGVSRRSRSSSQRLSGPRRVGGKAKAAKETTDDGIKKVKSDAESPSTRVRSLANARVGPIKTAARGFKGDISTKKNEGKLREKKVKDLESEDSGRETKLKVKKPKRKVAEEEDKPFTFGEFIKYLLIAGILIAIVIFLGGQLLQYSKESD